MKNPGNLYPAGNPVINTQQVRQLVERLDKKWEALADNYHCPEMPDSVTIQTEHGTLSVNGEGDQTAPGHCNFYYELNGQLVAMRVI